MKRSVSPMSVRVLSIVSLVFSLLWILAYVACIIFQKEIKIMFGAPHDVIDIFTLPISPLVSNGLILLVQSVFAIIIVAFWKKPVWGKGITLTFLVIYVVLMSTRSVFGGLVSTFETLMVGNIQGYTYLAALGSLNQMLNYTGIFVSTAINCMVIALSILAFRSCTDAKRFKV